VNEINYPAKKSAVAVTMTLPLIILRTIRLLKPVLLSAII
jgi:hypothetical protein